MEEAGPGGRPEVIFSCAVAMVTEARGGPAKPEVGAGLTGPEGSSKEVKWK